MYALSCKFIDEIPINITSIHDTSEQVTAI